MQLSAFEPDPRLAPVVRVIEIVEAAAETERTLIPECGVILGFRFGGASWLVEAEEVRETPGAAITGLGLTARRMRTAPGSGIVLAKLQPGRAAALLDGDLHSLFGRTRPLSTAVPRLEVERAMREVKEARTSAERVAAVERFLRSRAERRSSRPDPAIDQAVDAILADPGGVRIGALAARLGLSVDGLERRFRRRVGASPKQLASIARLRQAVIAAGRGSLGALAASTGYYDQAHLNRQFVALLGAAPGEFLSRAEYCVGEPARPRPEERWERTPATTARR